MVASLVETNWHAFFILWINIFASHVIETFQKRAVNDALYLFEERFTNVSMICFNNVLPHL